MVPAGRAAAGRLTGRSSPCHLWADCPSSGAVGRAPCYLARDAGWRLAVVAGGVG